MKLSFKNVAWVLVLVLVCTSFIGCSNTEMKVLDAIIKSNDMLSCEKDVEVSMNLDFEGIPEYASQQLEMAKEMINDSKFTMNLKMVRNEENTMSQQSIEGMFDIPDMPMDFGVWVDLNLNEEEPEFKEIIKMPAMAAGLMGPADKPYMVIDLVSMMNEVDTEEGDVNLDGLSELIKTSTETNKSAIEFIKDYAKDFDFGQNTIIRDGSQRVDGDILPKYQLKLNNSSTKKFMRHMVNDLLGNEEVFKFIEEMLLVQQKSMNSIYGDLGQPQPMDMPDQSDIEEFRTMFNEFMDKFEDVKILGDEGIKVDYVINDDGFIVYESGVIDIDINIDEIEKAMVGEEYYTEPEESNGSVQFKITYTIETKNINEDIKIEMPELTEENSYDIADLASAYEMELEPEVIEDVIDDSKDINVYVNDKKVEFNNKPLLVNGRTCVPVREVIEYVGGEVEWFADSQTIIITINDFVIDLMIDDDMAFVGEEVKMLDAPAKFINGITYVPVRFIAESIGGEVRWDPNTSSVHITY